MNTSTETLKKIADAITEYEAALKRREHGGIAGHRAFDAIRLAMDELASSPQQVVDPVGAASDDQAVFAIVYDDTEKPHEVIIGQAIAHARFAQISASWNAHLFGKIKSNSRDTRYYLNNVALATRPGEDAMHLIAAIRQEIKSAKANGQQLTPGFFGREGTGDPAVRISDLEHVLSAWQGAEGRCDVPPAGWWCSRTKGHEGPCAARQLDPQAARDAQTPPSVPSDATITVPDETYGVRTWTSGQRLVGLDKHNELTIAVWRLLAREFGADAANPVISGKCVDAVLAALPADSQGKEAPHG